MSRSVLEFKKTLYETNIPREIQAIIWDFYVSKSMANSSSQKRAISDFGMRQIPIREMRSIANLTSKEYYKMMACSTIDFTLKKLDLEITKRIKTNNNFSVVGTDIDITTPRLCCLMPFKVNEEGKVEKTESEAVCLLNHIRNSFAHGNTYFLDNGNVLLEDKNREKVTARILLSVAALIEWINLIDKDERYYPHIESNIDSWLSKT